MVKFMEKVKSLFCGKFVYKPKKREESKPQQEGTKAEERPGGQEQHPSA